MPIEKIDGDHPVWLKSMRYMSCIICRNDQDVVGHHVGRRKHMDDRLVLPLCQECHRQLHNDFVHEADFWMARARDMVIKGIQLIARKLYDKGEI